MSKTITIATSEDLVHTNNRITRLGEDLLALQAEVKRLEYGKLNAPRGLYGEWEPSNTRDLQRQMFGLFSLCFGTTEAEARHTFTRALFGYDDSGPHLSWALSNTALTPHMRLRIVKALEAITQVEDLIGRRVAV